MQVLDIEVLEEPIVYHNGVRWVQVSDLEELRKHIEDTEPLRLRLRSGRFRVRVRFVWEEQTIRDTFEDVVLYDCSPEGSFEVACDVVNLRFVYCVLSCDIDAAAFKDPEHADRVLARYTHDGTHHRPEAGLMPRLLFLGWGLEDYAHQLSEQLARGTIRLCLLHACKLACYEVEVTPSCYTIRPATLLPLIPGTLQPARSGSGAASV